MRTPIAERAPRRELCCSAAGAAARTGGMRENTNVPTAARTAAPTTGATGSTIASTATSSGPPTKITSCSAASRAYAVLAPSSPATVGQIERSTDETGGIVSPAAAAATRDRGERRVDRSEDRHDPEEGREQHHASPQHEPRATAIDLTATVRGADRDRDPVGRRDEPRLGVAGAATADEEHERERRHPDRQPRDDAPDEQRRGVVVGEELAVAGDAPRLLRSGRRAQDGRSTAEGSGPGGSRIFWRRWSSQSSTTTWIAPATGIAPSAPITPGELGSHQHGDQHDQRRQLHGATVDERLQHVVLELLVEDEEDHEHDARRSSSGGSRRR